MSHTLIWRTTGQMQRNWTRLIVDKQKDIELTCWSVSWSFYAEPTHEHSKLCHEVTRNKSKLTGKIFLQMLGLKRKQKNVGKTQQIKQHLWRNRESAFLFPQMLPDLRRISLYFLFLFYIAWNVESPILSPLCINSKVVLLKSQNNLSMPWLRNSFPTTNKCVHSIKIIFIYN